MDDPKEESTICTTRNPVHASEVIVSRLVRKVVLFCFGENVRPKLIVTREQTGNYQSMASIVPQDIRSLNHIV